MTRKSRAFCPVEALEPKLLLSTVRVAVERATAPGATVPTTTVSPSATIVTATIPNPTAPVANTLDGSYIHVGRSLSVMAEGNVASLGQVDVNGSIAVSGPKSAQNVAGMLLLAGSEGSITIQLEASKERGVVGGMPGPVTETVIGATGNGVSLQGESGSG